MSVFLQAQYFSSGAVSNRNGRRVVLFSIVLFVWLAVLLPRAAVAQQYLPLNVGNRWVLNSSAVRTPVVFEVVSQHDGQFELRFDNPWMKSTLMLKPTGDGIAITAVTINGQQASMPPDTIYWDFSQPKGGAWSNAIGTMTVLHRDKTVRARGATYNNCIEIRETNHQGNQNYWTFCPGIGFAQFGEQGAFILSETNVGPASAVAQHNPLSAPSGTGNGVPISISANPFANQPASLENVEARFQQARQAGIDFLYISPKWNEMEPKSGEYHFSEVDDAVRRASKYGLFIACNLRVVDTNQRSMPADLSKRAFDDPQVIQRLLGLINAMVPRFHGHIRYLMIGNEIDPYFQQHRSEVGPYVKLFQVAAQRAKQLDPNIQVSATITFGGVGAMNSLLAPLAQNFDFAAFTYYPLNDDFTMRGPETASRDLDRMVQAAGSKKIILQEVGYPSGTLNNSSEDRQAQFFSEVFKYVSAHPAPFAGINFFLMSDLSDSLVETFAHYYGLPHADRFRSYLKTLGMFDDHGQPKKSWDVFQKNAHCLAQGHGAGC